MGKGNNLTVEQKAEIVRLKFVENLPVWGIVEKMNLSKSTVYNVISEWKEHGDSAFSEEEIKNELHEQTISETTDDDYVCYEVTGDTDIDAYMADRDRKKPDTVAPVTDSEQEDLVDVPADIVSQPTENVKAEDVLPCTVVDAISDKIDMLYDKIAECDREMQRIKDARANAENDLNELKAFLRKNGYVEIVKMLASNAEWRALNESPNSL